MIRDTIPNTILPIKRKRRKGKTIKLTAEEKGFNQNHAKVRVAVEHVIAKLKKYQVLSQTYRSAEERYNRIFRNVASLINFRLEYAQL